MFYDEEAFPNGQMGITIPNVCLHDTNTLKYQKKKPPNLSCLPSESKKVISPDSRKQTRYKGFVGYKETNNDMSHSCLDISLD